MICLGDVFMYARKVKNMYSKKRHIWKRAIIQDIILVIVNFALMSISKKMITWFTSQKLKTSTIIDLWKHCCSHIQLLKIHIRNGKWYMFAAYGVYLGAIVKVLQHKNSRMHIHNCDIFNLINSINYQKNKVNSDAGSVYLNLIKQKEEDLSFHIDVQFERKENHLVWLCWICSNQQELWSWFHNIVLLNTTAKINWYLIILCAVILVDNYNHLRLATTTVCIIKQRRVFHSCSKVFSMQLVD